MLNVTRYDCHTCIHTCIHTDIHAHFLTLFTLHCLHNTNNCNNNVTLSEWPNSKTSETIVAQSQMLLQLTVKTLCIANALFYSEINYYTVIISVTSLYCWLLFSALPIFFHCQLPINAKSCNSNAYVLHVAWISFILFFLFRLPHTPRWLSNARIIAKSSVLGTPSVRRCDTFCKITSNVFITTAPFSKKTQKQNYTEFFIGMLLYYSLSIWCNIIISRLSDGALRESFEHLNVYRCGFLCQNFAFIIWRFFCSLMFTMHSKSICLLE